VSETVLVNIISLGNNLKRMGAVDLFLKIAEKRGKCAAPGFDFNEEPWFTVSYNEKIDLPLLLVPDVPQFEGTESEIRP